MPEGAEAHHCAQVLQSLSIKMILLDILFPEENALKIEDLDKVELGSKIDKIYAVGKRIIISLVNGVHIVFSLGLTGRFLVKDDKHTRATLVLGAADASYTCPVPPLQRNGGGDEKEIKMDEEKGEIKMDEENCEIKMDEVGKEMTKIKEEKEARKLIYYDDTRMFSRVQVFRSRKLFQIWRLKKLGWDPLATHVNKEENDEKKETEMEKYGITFNKFKSIFSRSVKIGTLLGEQENICGIGNYLRAEILYNAEISPHRKSNTLKEEELKKLFSSILKIMRASFERGGHTLDSFVDPLGRRGKFEPKVYISKYKPNQDYFTNDHFNYPVKREKFGSQYIFWCPYLQK
jgi:formamidopyrimidine-DNA glycosylase